MTSDVLTVPYIQILFSPPTQTVGSNSLREIILNLDFDIHRLHFSAFNALFTFVDWAHNRGHGPSTDHDADETSAPSPAATHGGIWSLQLLKTRSVVSIFPLSSTNRCWPLSTSSSLVSSSSRWRSSADARRRLGPASRGRGRHLRTSSDLTSSNRKTRPASLQWPVLR